ncbi:hypothetical protein, partial [Gardnerella vaginalis]|uniref:hypothetical protein n=1 Tax=Gardnerella vaginalis TaxID=2702 RepID=UPI00197A88B6
KLCVLIVNNLILSQRFFDFSSSLDLSVAYGSDVRLRSVQKISNLYHTGICATKVEKLSYGLVHGWELLLVWRVQQR